MTSPDPVGYVRWVFAAAAVVLVAGVVVAAVATPTGDEADDLASPAASVSPADATTIDLMEADLAGWVHAGAGRFLVEQVDGEPVYVTGGGLGVLWSERVFRDFTLTFDVMVDGPGANSGVFLRIPQPPTSDASYIASSFEVQLAPGGVGREATGAIFSVQEPLQPAPLEPGRWHTVTIIASGPSIEVAVDGRTVNNFQVRSEGVVTSFRAAGHLGFQNHPASAGGDEAVRFRRIQVTEH